MALWVVANYRFCSLKISGCNYVCHLYQLYQGTDTWRTTGNLISTECSWSLLEMTRLIVSNWIITLGKFDVAIISHSARPGNSKQYIASVLYPTWQEENFIFQPGSEWSNSWVTVNLSVFRCSLISIILTVVDRLVKHPKFEFQLMFPS